LLSLPNKFHSLSLNLLPTEFKLRTQTRSTFRQLAFCAGFCITLFSASLLAQEATGGDYHFDLSLDGLALDDGLGFSVAPLGDLNGDGISDFAAGANLASPNGTRSGQVLVYSGADGTILLQLDGRVPAERFGSSISATGDLDNDGIQDLLVGAILASPGGLNFAGSVYAISGATGVELFRIDGTDANDFLGEDIDTIEDLNGDGIDDLLVSQTGWQGGAILKIGAVQVISGADGSLIRRIEGTDLVSNFGNALATVNDTDGDGIQDILVGAYLADPNAVSNAGSVFLYSGATGNLLQRIDGFAGQQAFGVAVASAGDVNGDGSDDLLIGANQFGLQSGEAYVYSGATGDQIYLFEGGQNSKLFGGAVAAAGDINGDGVPDQMIGDWRECVNQIDDTGAVYFYSGADGSLMQRVPGTQNAAAFGYSIASLRGSTDFLVGAPNATAGGQTLAGMVHTGGVDPYLMADSLSISSAAGGTLTYQLDFPDDHAGLKSIMVASFAGPGTFSIFGIELPLQGSPLLNRTIAAFQPGSVATLDAFGNGTVQVVFAPNQLRNGVGDLLEICALGVDPVGSLPLTVSIPAILEITP